MEKDGWEVFLNGRVQTFLNYNEGQGSISAGTVWLDKDANALMDPNLGQVTVRDGGITREEAQPEWTNGMHAPTDQGVVREMRLRSGFTGNVLGFGIRKRLSERTELLGYTAVTVGVDSEQRRKFSNVRPDWRESFVGRPRPGAA